MFWLIFVCLDHAYAKCSLRNYSSAIIYITPNEHGLLGRARLAYWWGGMWAAVGLSLALWLLGLVVVFVHIVYIFAFVAAEYLLV